MVVLSFLAILLVLAVTFLASMRTERLASEAQKDGAACEQFLKGCVASAMDRVNDRLINYSYNDALALPASDPRPVNIHQPKQMAVLESYSTNALLKVPSTMNMLAGEVQGWIPHRFLSNVDPDLDASNIAQNAQWIEVRDPTNPVTGNVVGRYAFVALDCTGLIDANVADGGLRSNGVWVDEINLDFLPEVGASKGDDLVANRSKYTRFATLPEVVYLNDGTPSPGENKVIATNAIVATDLVPYSLSYIEPGWYDWNSEAWRPLGDLGDGTVHTADPRRWDAAEAQSVLGSLYPSSPDIGKCFRDYIDDDFIPGGSTAGTADPLIPCQECFPMINELVSRQIVSVVDVAPGVSNLVNTVILDVEFWNPCVTGSGTNGNTYQVRLNSVNWQFVFAPGGTIVTPPIDPVNPKTLPASAMTPFQVVSFTNVLSIPYPATGNRIVNQFFNQISLDVTEVGTGANVDRTTQQSQDLQLGPATAPYPRNNGPNADSLQANDPRLNHLSADWVKAANSLRAINAAVVDFNKSQTLLSNGSLSPEGTNAYVRNSTNLTSVAELGYILTGQPWTTIDLFTPPGRQLLTKFSLSNVVTRAYTNGFINPNTLSTDVWIAALSGAPIEGRPDEPLPAAATLSQANAGKIGASVVALATKDTTFEATSLDSGAAWVTASEFTNSSFSLNNNEKESVIRNSYRLFNANQNLFTLIVVAQTLNEERVVTGEKRAVALVWRDPFPNGAGQYEMFVRQFRYLD
ncbi:MAG: hypothetical protein K1Y02_23270 [Candidatus Hydrogenedentes bacterium]|nr:hypothetical protein [Candidatus Hydrogenedentota bacterium]